MGGLVRKVIERLEESKFADMIAGYQMSGGNTEEWFCLDLEGCTSGKGAYKPFCRYLERKGIEPPNALPSLEDLNNIADDVYVREYLDFVNIESARTVEYFCKCAKEACGYRKMIGAFYGYSLEVPSPLWGTHALYSIIDSPYIDFFSSPNSYATSRAPGVDWGDMIPAGSVKLHGKHLFSECDVRTTLTLAPESSRPGSDRERFYSSDIWKGPEKIEVSASVMAKSAAHQLAGGYGMWLFDMFGHWYDNEELLRVMEDYSELYKLAGESKLCEPIAGKLAVFADETMYRKVKWGEECSHALIDMREGLANVGVPFDVYLIEDFERVMGKENIGAVVFMIPCESEYKERGIDYCKSEGIEYLEATGEKWKFTPCEYRELMKRSSSHVYSESEDVVYVGEGVISLHAAHSGEKKLTLPGKVKVRACVATPYDKEEQKEYRVTEREKTTEIEFSCQQYETVTFVCEF